MTASTRAWILDVAAGWHIAVGSRHVIEYLLSPEATAIPLAPAHCQGMLVWRDRLIPLVDLRPLLDMQKTSRHEPRRALILGYWDSSRQAVRYGALVVRTAPTDVAVSDDMACPLPEEPAVIKHLCRSCIVRRDEIIPILDTARLFSQPLPLTLLPRNRADEEDVHGNGVGQEDGSVSPVVRFATHSERAGTGFVSVPRSATTSLPDGRDERAWQSVASFDYSALTAHTPTPPAAAMDSAEGQYPGSINMSKEVTAPISERETNTPGALSADSAATAAVVNNQVETGPEVSALHARHEGAEMSLAKPPSSMVRAVPIASASPNPRSSPFRESLERRNARRRHPSSGVRRRAGYITTVMVVLAGALYGGLVWRSHLPQAGEASRQMAPLEPASPRPAPVSVPSAPVQPPK